MNPKDLENYESENPLMYGKSRILYVVVSNLGLSKITTSYDDAYESCQFLVKYVKGIETIAIEMYLEEVDTNSDMLYIGSAGMYIK